MRLNLQMFFCFFLQLSPTAHKGSVGQMGERRWGFPLALLVAACSAALLLWHVGLMAPRLVRLESLMRVRAAATEAAEAAAVETAPPEPAPGFGRCRAARPGEVVPHLRAVQQWRHSGPRRRESITLVTQLSVER